MLVVRSLSSLRTRAGRAVPLATATLVVASLVACGGDTAPAAPHELDGTSVSVGHGSAYAYAISGPGGVSSIGIALTPSALDGLPEADAMWDLPLPAGVSVPPFDHLMLNWNVQGHPPAMYQVPHFDFHFYTITPAAQAAIQAGPDTMPVPSADVPRGYISGVEAVPDMGVHWVDTSAAEFHGNPFDATYVYGFYHGSLVFVEPMVSRAFLETKPNVTALIKQPETFVQPGDYPASYSVRTDPATGILRISLDSLSARPD